jgi:hypothetical protein
VQARFDAARDEDYAEVSATARELATRYSGADLANRVARLRKQLDEIVAIDFFGADGPSRPKAWSQASRPGCNGRRWT